MSQELVLFDLPSQGHCRSWSLNTWKARSVLNFKNVPYRTEWVNFPQIESRMKELGVPPNPEGSWANYTVPVVQFADGSLIMDSKNIVPELEATYPEPSLHLDTELQTKATKAMGALANPLLPVFMPRLRRDVQREDSSAWIKADRERRFGLPEDQWEQEQGGEKAWKAAEEAAPLVREFLKENKKDAGPFVLGSQVCYADLMVAGVLEMFRCIGTDMFERTVEMVPGLRELHQACQPWFKRNDY